MVRPSGPKTRCGGLWTEAKFTAFIKNNLRQASRKWAPISQALKNARIRRGFYRCSKCRQEITASIKNAQGRRVKNAIVDHIKCVIDPKVGWTNWDDCINRMFCEIDNLQVLCYDCHKIKTDVEKAQTKARRNKEKE